MDHTGGDSWCLIESDPGVFGELVEKVGVKGVRFEEVFVVDDVDSQFAPNPVHGLIFLFKHLGKDTGAHQKAPLSYPPPGLFFAKQVIQNACATQAILSVLMNAKDVEIGSELKNFKEFAAGLGGDPEMVGQSIGSQEKIRSVHNSFARHSSFDFVKDDDDDKDDAFHFVGYVPHNGKVYELDGLQSGPIEVGTVPEGKNWLETAKGELKRRIDAYQSAGNTMKDAGMFNLLAITPNPHAATEKRILVQRALKQNCSIKLLSLGEDLDELDDEVDEDEIAELGSAVPGIEELPDDVAAIRSKISEAERTMDKLKADSEFKAYRAQKQRYTTENERRRHDYVPLLLNVLTQLAKKGKLMDAYGKAKVKATEEWEKKQAEKKAKEGDKSDAK